MKIEKKVDGTKMMIALQGRLDTMTAPELDKELQGSLSGIAQLVFDLSKLDYVSSAGLRVLLSAQKVMNKQGTMKVLHANSIVLKIFQATGFADVLTIE